MIQFLIKTFIKNHEKTEDRAVRTAYGNLACIVSVVCNLLLAGGKIAVGVLTGSVAVTADGMNNLSDASSNIVSLLGFKLGARPADSEHPYGHARYEYLAGLAVSVMILVIGVELLKESFAKVLHPTAVDFNWVMVAVLAASIFVKLWMARLNHKIGTDIESETLLATAADARNDVITTAAVLAATVLTKLSGFTRLDGLMGLGVAAFILYSGAALVRDTINPLLGQAPDPEFVTKIRSIVLSHPQIMGIHDLLVHDYGPGRRMISLHAEVNAQGNFVELHDLIDNIERELQQKLSCSAVIHMDPVITDDPEINELRHKVTDIVYRLDEQLTLHDFRIIRGPTHTNVIFDVVVPFHFKMTDAQLRSWLDKRIKQIDPSYFCVINIDKN